METIKRYGVKMGDLSKDAAFKGSASAGRGVPEKFMETPGRMWLKRMIRVMGLFSFVVTVFTILIVFSGMLLPMTSAGAVGEVLSGITAGLFFVNHMGLLIEMGGDSAGKNWFAKGVGLMWLSLFGTFLIAVMVEIATVVF
jgi:hypothetical protein